MKSFIDQYRTMLDEAIEMFGMVGLQNLVGVNRRNIKKWKDEDGYPRADSLAALADKLGYRLVKAGIRTNKEYTLEDVDGRVEGYVFIDGLYSREVNPADYRALPMVKDLNKVDGNFIPDSNFDHWGIVHKTTESLLGRTNLLAMRINDSLLAPVLEPGDIVIIDRDDKEIEQDKIYLVRTPKGETVLRRVMASDVGATTRFSFYCNDKQQVEHYALHEYYGNNINNVILGRGVWFRGDLRNL